MADQPERIDAKRGFMAELGRRHVWRAAVLYIGAAWALTQGIAQLGPLFHAPDWAMRWFVIACAIGFPFWIAFAWFFAWTPDGFKREENIERSASLARATGRKLDFWIIGVLAVAVALLASGYLVQRGSSAIAAQTIPAKSIAVLPFESLSTNKKNAYFAAGIQDLILTRLADIGGLKVIARTSTMKYQSHPADLATIGKQLGVATLLEGSVQRAGDEVMINVQLINAQTRAHVWAKAYTRKLDNVFSVEGEVAGKIAAALKTKLSPAETARLANVPTTNPTASNAYLKAQYQFNRSLVRQDRPAMRAALPLYRQAVAADPNFALAWAKLSYAESLTAWWGGGGASVPKLKAAARKDAVRAQALQPDATATQLALGYVAYYGKGDYAAALTAFRAALAGQPNSTEAMAAIGFVLRRLNRRSEAIAEFQRALVLDPRNADLTSVLAATYMDTRRYAEALAPLRRALALAPDNASYRSEYAQAIVYGSGDLTRAWAAAQGDALPLKSMRVALLVWQRQYAAAITLVEAIPDRPANFGLNSLSGESKALTLADLYRLAGDTAHSQPLYAKARAQLQADRKAQAGNALNLAIVQSLLADAELGLDNRKAAFAATAKSLKLAAQLKLFNQRLSLQSSAAGIYAQAGRADLAVPLLAKLLAAPDGGSIIAPVVLRLSPRFDPIRHDPRFQALLKQYPAPTATATPASAASTPNQTQSRTSAY